MTIFDLSSVYMAQYFMTEKPREWAGVDAWPSQMLCKCLCPHMSGLYTEMLG